MVVVADVQMAVVLETAMRTAAWMEAVSAVELKAMLLWLTEAMAVAMEAVVVVTHAEGAAAVLEASLQTAAWTEAVRAVEVRSMAVWVTEAMAVAMEAMVVVADV